MSNVPKLTCPGCGAEMNFHAEKVDYGTDAPEGQPIDPAFGGIVEEFHTCPDCSRTVTRPAAQGG
jgi:hypothetical protein